MTSKVNFYVLQGTTMQDACYFACRITDQAIQKKLKVYVHTDSANTSDFMDDLLWSFRPDSFIPHIIEGQETDENVQVIIGHSDAYTGSADILLNLSTVVPDFHSRFETIAEIVLNEDQHKSLKRQHWAQYQALGYEMKRHEISS